MYLILFPILEPTHNSYATLGHNTCVFCCHVHIVDQADSAKKGEAVAEIVQGVGQGEYRCCV